MLTLWHGVDPIVKTMAHKIKQMIIRINDICNSICKYKKGAEIRALLITLLNYFSNLGNSISLYFTKRVLRVSLNPNQISRNSGIPI